MNPIKSRSLVLETLFCPEVSPWDGGTLEFELPVEAFEAVQRWGDP